VGHLGHSEQKEQDVLMVAISNIVAIIFYSSILPGTAKQ
jgi:hypothetical protein